MKLQGPNRTTLSCNTSSLVGMCREAIEILDGASDLPVDKLEWEVDRAEIAAVKLRDCLIGLLREDNGSTGAEQSRWRSPLDQVNVAISLITGVEYPSAGVHRGRIEQAKKTLSEVSKMLPS